MFCFCVSMQLHISNTEHVKCACNDYKLQELTFKVSKFVFCELLELSKGELWNYKLFKCYSYYPLPELCFVSIKSC